MKANQEYKFETLIQAAYLSALVLGEYEAARKLLCHFDEIVEGIPQNEIIDAIDAGRPATKSPTIAKAAPATDRPAAYIPINERAAKAATKRRPGRPARKR